MGDADEAVEVGEGGGGVVSELGEELLLHGPQLGAALSQHLLQLPGPLAQLQPQINLLLVLLLLLGSGSRIRTGTDA